MHSFKEKVTATLNRLFADSPTASSDSSSPCAYHPEARPYSKGGKSSSSYFSFITPSVGTRGSRSGKDQYGFIPIEPQPDTFECKKFNSQDGLLDDYIVCNGKSDKETKNNQENDEFIDDEASRGSTSSSEVFEETTDQNSLPKPLPNLIDESVFITPDLYEFLHSSIPNIVKGCKWALLYSTSKHGISLRTLIRKSGDLSGPCLLIVGDMQGAVFGGLLESPLKPTPKRKYQGTNQTFVFTTIYGEPRLFRPTGANRYYYLCLDDLLALGGGGNFALRLDGDLLNGTSGPCDTFGNKCLANSPEFELRNVELWGFTHASQYLT